MTIYLIRHGQSEFNAAHNDGEPDPMIFDAPLTDLGRQQAMDARDQAATLGVAEVLTSPLTRAIQTALLIFDGIAPIRVIADHREKLTHSCDIGRAPASLRQDFPDLAFDHLGEVWWHQGLENENGVPVETWGTFQNRIDTFAETLPDYTNRPLAIVGHGDTFRALAGVSMANCEIYKYA